MTADEILASKTVDQINAAIEKGKKLLIFYDELQRQDENYISDSIGTEHHTSKAYEVWTSNDTERRKQLVRLGIADSQRELARRQHKDAQP